MSADFEALQIQNRLRIAKFRALDTEREDAVQHLFWYLTDGADKNDTRFRERAAEIVLELRQLDKAIQAEKLKM